MNDYFENHIKTLTIDTTKVFSFASGKTATYLATQENTSHELSMVPTQPHVKGLVHFYEED